MNLLQDVRYGARKLRNSPAFALTAILTMALGIGVTTAIFSVCDALLWRPVPLPHLDRLAIILQQVPGDPNEWTSLTPADSDDPRHNNNSFESLAVWDNGLANLAGSGGEPERVIQALVTRTSSTLLAFDPPAAAPSSQATMSAAGTAKSS